MYDSEHVEQLGDVIEEVGPQITAGEVVDETPPAPAHMDPAQVKALGVPLVLVGLNLFSRDLPPQPREVYLERAKTEVVGVLDDSGFWEAVAEMIPAGEGDAPPWLRATMGLIAAGGVAVQLKVAVKREVNHED